MPNEAMPILYLYPESRWAGNAGRQYLLPEALSRHAPLVFLSTAAPSRSIRDVRRPHAEQIGPNVTVLHDAMSLRTNRWWRRLGSLAAAIDGVLIHRVLKQHGMDDYIFWLSVPDPKWMAGMQLDRMVYDCIDPCFVAEDQVRFDEREFEVAAQADLVFCTATALLHRMQQVHDNAHLLNNAASPELYSVERTRTAEVPSPLRGRPRPIVGHIGTIDWRIDCETLTAAAQALPDYTFCLAGRVNMDQEHRVTDLRALPNVVMPGPVSPEESAAYNKAFDVGMIPYLPGSVGDGLNPVKMYMHLMAGKPVVGTWTSECRRNQPLVAATRTPEEFVAALRAAANESDPDAPAARIDFAMRNTWGDRAQRAMELIRRGGLVRSSGERREDHRTI